MDPVSAEAYSHEVIAFGFWPGDDRRTPYPAFYSYTAPEPDDLRSEPLEPSQAQWQEAGSGSLAILPYHAVRTTPDPHQTLLSFYESAYRAGASRAGWDIAAFTTSRALDVSGYSDIRRVYRLDPCSRGGLAHTAAPEAVALVIARLVLFGASGDLAGRFLLPALAALHSERRLPAGFSVLGAAGRDWDDDAFRRFAAECLQRHAADVPASTREALLAVLHYRQVDAADPPSVAPLVRDGPSASNSEPLIAYLALPQELFAPAMRALAAAGLPEGSRVAMEKPFGEDQGSASKLNALLAEIYGPAREQAVFRIDHVLGMATVQNLIALRLANPVLEAVWNSEYVEEVNVLWEETLALEGRAGFYDRAGALKDVMQNHMMQVLSLAAMEPPASLADRDLRDAKLDALRAVRPLDPGDASRQTRRARYTAGRLSGTGGAEEREVPSYVDEDGVDPDRYTETFAELLLELDNERWTGTRFRLRAGKALAGRCKGVVVRFRSVQHQRFGEHARPVPDELRIGLDGPNDLRLRLAGRAPGPQHELAPLELVSPPYEAGLPGYARVLLDLLSGGSTLSVRGDEAEAAWRIVTPALQAWADGKVPMDEYPAGSEGPPPLGGSGQAQAHPCAAG